MFLAWTGRVVNAPGQQDKVPLAGLVCSSFSGRVYIPGCHSGGLWPGAEGFCWILATPWSEMETRSPPPGRGPSIASPLSMTLFLTHCVS